MSLTPRIYHIENLGIYELIKGYKSIKEIQKEIPKELKKELDGLIIGDILDFSDYRMTKSFLIGPEGRLIRTEDYSGHLQNYFPNFPYEVSKYYPVKKLLYNGKYSDGIEKYSMVELLPGFWFSITDLTGGPSSSLSEEECEFAIKFSKQFPRSNELIAQMLTMVNGRVLASPQRIKKLYKELTSYTGTVIALDKMNIPAALLNHILEINYSPYVHSREKLLKIRGSIKRLKIRKNSKN